ncbi:LysR family transcriptional regulator [Actinomadura logoneensis]|uniref:LysR family transcriptional regulator n=1 Tax=Actinomadura logoneensis TaxID=2293572 RepID=UPI0018F17171|nr:LysR substrate-binding domain-containing protein [Actinomadura logoneensis]
MSDLEVRQLRYFVAVAEELHFGRAAARLGMAQPPLSRAIRELERQLGVALLERTTRSVRLTSAGEVLLRDARIVLEAVGAAGRRARHAGKPRQRLRLALKADNDGGMLSAILAAYQQEDAALPVELVWGGRGEQPQALRDGRADVGLLLSPFDDRGLDSEPLRTEPRMAVLAADDPLAARTSLHLADLSGRVLPDGSPVVPGETPASPDDIRDKAAERGLVAEGRPSVADLSQVFRLVELGCVVCLLPAWVTRANPRAELAYVPLVDVEPAVLSVGWPRDARSPATAAFVRAAQAAFASVPVPPATVPPPTVPPPTVASAAVPSAAGMPPTAGPSGGTPSAEGAPGFGRSRTDGGYPQVDVGADAGRSPHPQLSERRADVG